MPPTSALAKKTEKAISSTPTLTENEHSFRELGHKAIGERVLNLSQNGIHKQHWEVPTDSDNRRRHVREGQAGRKHRQWSVRCDQDHR